MAKPMVFICYDRKDDLEKEQLLTHLSVLQEAGILEVWSDDRLKAGDDWRAEINHVISQANIAILLVSANFLSSDFILEQEVPLLLERAEQEGLAVFPVIAKACAWQQVSWLTKMEVRPRQGKAIWGKSGNLIDEELTAIAQEVARLATGEEGWLKEQPRPGALPSLPYEPQSVLIPAGSFLMGSPEGAEVPVCEKSQHELDLPDFHIGKYPVTVAEYAEFVKQTRQPAPKKVGWFGQSPRTKLDHPVVAVSWYDALAYCQWLSKQTGRPYRLPSEAEWEKAARGSDGRIYPWGNSWDVARCNCAAAQTTPVTAFPDGQSPYGCWDMVGNVGEWIATQWGSNWQHSDYSYPYRPNDGREDLSADADTFRLFRGGSFGDDLSYLRCSARRWYAPENTDKARGFRVALGH